MSYNDPYQQQQDPYQQQQPQPQYPYQQQPQFQYPAQGYPPMGYAPPGTSGQTNVMAILSLVFAFFIPLLGIIFGHIAKRQIRERNEQGSGLATAGLIISYIFVGITLLILAFAVIGALLAASNSGTTG